MERTKRPLYRLVGEMWNELRLAGVTDVFAIPTDSYQETLPQSVIEVMDRGPPGVPVVNGMLYGVQIPWFDDVLLQSK